MGVGDYERALEALNRLADQEGPDKGSVLFGWFKNNYWGDPILDQPEFVEVRSRLGFRE